MKSRREFLYRASAVALAFSFSAHTEAHARLVRSQPKSDSQAIAPLRRIELWFNELLDEKFNTIELFTADQASEKNRENLLREKPAVDPKDRTHLSVNVPELKAGAYVVEYRVLSRDGHTAPGRFSFTIGEKLQG